MKFSEAVLVFILGNEFARASSNTCRNTESCSCTRTLKEYKFRCLSSNNSSVVINTEPGKYFDLVCLPMGPASRRLVLDLEILPKYVAGKTEKCTLRSCTLSRNNLFSIFEKFSLERLENLHLEDVVPCNSLSEETNFTKGFFQGLPLRNLTIFHSGSTIEVDSFENLPNLTTLELDGNGIKEIGGMFTNLKYLKVLHLSRNAIMDIPNDTFQNLQELQQLHLWQNNLTRVKKNYFSGLENLKYLDLSKNSIQVIDSDAFSHLKNLSIVNLEQCNLRIIPKHVFEGSRNLKILKMRNNLLQKLPNDVFSESKKLKELYLSWNKISIIPDEVFSPLVNLEILDLENNLISEINDNTFKMNKKLKTLILKHNKIKTVTLGAFSNNKNLIFMDLSHNFYDMKHIYGNPFENCPELEQLLLSGNLIDEFPSSIMQKLYLKKLDLSYNKITTITVVELLKLSVEELTVDLSNNIISELNFESLEYIATENVREAKNNTGPATTVLLYNNTLACDCNIYHLSRYVKNMLKPAVKIMVDLKLGDNRCTSPKLLENLVVRDLNPQYISCPYLLPCQSSRECQCFYRPFDEIVVVDCSYKNLTDFPRIQVEAESVEMNLTGNMLSYSPNSGLGYENVINMILTSNMMEEIDWIPPKTKVLKLDGNQLKHLNSEVLEMMKNTSALTLSNNPWTCDCSAVDFQNFIRKYDGILMSKNIVCKEDKKLLTGKIQLCEPVSNLILPIVIPILVFIVFTVVCTTLYFIYEQEAKIWLFGNGYLLWLITEKELDKDKIYDIFISYSHKDEHFVIEELLPELERSPNPFKTCLHLRDWKPGATITENISYSVNQSRRTLVVLSNDFLESVWGIMEFKAAHTKAIEEGRARVIVVKYGELEEEKIDEELELYLKTNTYVEWGKPWFWRKLRYALPHNNLHDIHKNQKHANAMSKIDRNFELTSPSIPYYGSNLAVIDSDSSLLKYHPASSQVSNNLDTPAKTPLVITQ